VPPELLRTVRAVGDDTRLRILRLVAASRSGYHVLYAADRDALERLPGALRSYLAGMRL
jgi:hypothetical protein